MKIMTEASLSQEGLYLPEEEDEGFSVNERPTSSDVEAEEFAGETEKPKIGIARILSVEGMIFLPMAVILDLVSIALICFGLDDFGITDIIGIIFIGGWVLFRSFFKFSDLDVEAPARIGKAAAEKRQQRKEIVQTIKQTVKTSKTPIKAICFIGELIPYIGALPFWTFLVYDELGK